MNSRNSQKRLIGKLLDANYNSKDKVSNEQAQFSLIIKQTQGRNVCIKEEIQAGIAHETSIATDGDKILQTVFKSIIMLQLVSLASGH